MHGPQQNQSIPIPCSFNVCLAIQSQADYVPYDSDLVDVSELPDRVVEGTNPLTTPDSVPKLPLMDALNDAMQEITIHSVLTPSASTSALSSMSCPLTEVLGDPLSDGIANGNGWKEAEAAQCSSGSETVVPHGGCLTTDDVDCIQNMMNEFCIKSLLPQMERQMKLLNEAVRPLLCL